MRQVVVDLQKKVALIVGLMAGKGGCKAEELCRSSGNTTFMVDTD